MSVPAFKDLGKQAKDVFEENYSKDVTVELKNFGQEPTTTTVNLTAAGAYKGSLQQKARSCRFQSGRYLLLRQPLQG